VIDNSLGVLALLVGILFIRHRNDDESHGFRWLGAGYLLYFANHVWTGSIAAAFPRTLGWNSFALVTASVTLACLLIGLHKHSTPRGLAATAAAQQVATLTQFLGAVALMMLALVLVKMGRPGYTPLIHAVPAAVAGYGAVQQARLFRAEPFMGHELTAASLASHPIAWSLLALAEIEGETMQQVLSIPFVLAGVATFSASRLRIQARMQQSRLDRSTGFLTPEGFAEVADKRLAITPPGGTWIVAAVRLQVWERSFRALHPGSQQLALTTLAQRMADPIGRERHIGRMGSAEFLLLMRDARIEEDADGADDLQELLHRLGGIWHSRRSDSSAARTGP
jgi:GGDEF domain-containing protein